MKENAGSYSLHRNVTDIYQIPKAFSLAKVKFSIIHEAASWYFTSKVEENLVIFNNTRLHKKRWILLGLLTNSSLIFTSILHTDTRLYVIN